MPNLQDIERFKQDIRTLGRETELLQQWGEVYEDIPPPEQGIPADLSELVGPAKEEPAREGEAAGDLASFLDNLSMEPLPGMEEPESPLGSDLEAPEDFFVRDTSASVEEMGKPVPEFEGLDESAREEGLADLAGKEPPEAFFDEEPAVPEGLLEGLAGDLESTEAGEPEAVFEPSPATEETTEGAPGIVEDLSAFEIPETPLEEAEAVPEAEPPAADEFSFEPPEVPKTAGFPETGQPPETPEVFEIPEEAEAPPEAGISEAPAVSEESAAFEEIPLGPEELSLLGEAEAESELVSGEEEISFALPEEPAEAPPAEEQGPGEAPFEDFDFSIPELEGQEAPAAPPSAGGAEPGAEETAADFGELTPEIKPADSADDSFDSFRLDESAPSSAAAPSGEAEGLNLDAELASLENDLTPSENFNLESAWGGSDFSIPGYETPAPAKQAVTGKPRKPERPRSEEEVFREPPSEEEGPAPEVALSEDEVDSLQDTLLSYPLNLRLAVEEAIAEEKGTEDQRSRLVHLLVKGGSPADAANLAGRILKRPVFVPKGFEKRLGAELEAEKGSLRYILIHTVAPIAAMVMAVVFGLGALGFLGYRFVYRPIKSEIIYRQGYEEIRADRFPEAEATFSQADEIWVHKRWYYRYAEAFAAKNQFMSAARRYDALLSRWPNDRKGVLDYAAMEFRSRLDYPKAAGLLKTYIEARNYFDQDALLLLGDVYLEWAETEGRRGERLFEDARLQYSTLIERHGQKDAYMERMLRWFLKTDQVLGRDNTEEILSLRDRFMDNPESVISAGTLAELGGYLMDTGLVENVSRILLRAVQTDPSVPEAHFELARYFRFINNPQEERAALANTIRLLEAVENPTNRRIGILVEALNRQGEGYAELREYVTAEELFTRAINRYERALSLGQLSRNAVHGKSYSNLGDILFFQRDDLDGALALYTTAERHGYITPESLYKQGYIHYRRERWEPALENFYRAGLDSEESLYLLYSTGNTLFQREDYFAAQGYYARLMDRLEFELDQLPLAEPQVRPSHGEIVDLLMRVSNNLGAALYRIGDRMGDSRRRAEAMAQFVESSRYFDSLERDPGTMIRPETKNLGYLNMDYVLHPQRGIDLSIYPDLPKSMEYPKK